MSSLPIDPSSSSSAASPLRFADPDSDTTQTNPAEQTSPLSEAHFKQLQLAARRARPIDKAARYANFSGWTTLLAGALSIPFALGNTPMLIFAIVIAAIGTHELTLRRSLKAFTLGSTKKLAFNQVFLAGALIIYAVVMLTAAPAKTMIESAMEADPMMQSTPEIKGMMTDMISLEQTLNMFIYVAMIAMAIIFQGSTALYYLLKGSKLKKMHNETPHWVLSVFQTINR